MQKLLKLFCLGLLAFSYLSPSYAAKPINMAHQSIHYSTLITNQISFKESSRELDFKKNQHIHFKQYYQNYPVWGGDVIVHPKKHTQLDLMSLLKLNREERPMNGIIYDEIHKDLLNTPAYVFSENNSLRALKEARLNAGSNISQVLQQKMMVYIAADKKAHWVYFIRLQQADPSKPSQPTYIMDATNYKIYKKWDNIQTINTVTAGGYGGNKKTGKISYDGLNADMPTLTVNRIKKSKICYLKNTNVAVRAVKDNSHPVNFNCEKINSTHGGIYWDDALDPINGAYSPSNDALFAGEIIQDLYAKWYGIPVLKNEDGTPMLLTMMVHADMENAYWDGKKMTFGDGGDDFYPLVSVGVGAHEVSHGFTEQHSGLEYFDQSGGLNESFSDMAAQAAEFYAFGKSSWAIGAEILKDSNGALRYMDIPSKDCEGRLPGKECSIDKYSQYYDGINVHYSSGIFNRLFYLLSHEDNWNVRRAFNVMVQANQHYWTPLTTFNEAACGVIKSSQDYAYDVKGVVHAMMEVGLDAGAC